MAEAPTARYNRAMIWMVPAAAAVTLLSALLTWVALRYLQRRAILDHPNERSSHSIPTPRGGGIAVVCLTIAAWLVPVSGKVEPATLAALTAAGALAVVSWIDDLKSLTPLVRLAAQAAAAVVALAWLDGPSLVFQGLLPAWLDTVLAGLLLVWFVNLFNFMDGIDAISAAECIAVCLGLLVLGLLRTPAGVPPWLPFALAAAMLGFLWWNRPPARVFLGDVGSVPVGFLLGWMLLKTAAAGYWAVALILPLYYLADATITLLRRAVRGARLWQAHREHFYQRAVQAGRSHASVSGAVFLGDVLLIGLAIASLEQPGLAIVLAAGVVAALIRWMRR